MPFDSASSMDISMTAGADLTGCRYRFVKRDTSGRAILATACTDKIVGVLQTEAKAINRPVAVRILGETLLKYGAAANEGDWLTAGVEGYGTVTTQAGAYVAAECAFAPGGSGDVQMAHLRFFKF